MAREISIVIVIIVISVCLFVMFVKFYFAAFFSAKGHLLIPPSFNGSPHGLCC